MPHSTLRELRIPFPRLKTAGAEPPLHNLMRSNPGEKLCKLTSSVSTFPLIICIALRVKLYLSVEKSSIGGATQAAADWGTPLSATVTALSATVASSGVLFRGVGFFAVRKNLVNCLSIKQEQSASQARENAN
jgi:hypothetical protein